jgi:hypothetical protein
MSKPNTISKQTPSRDTLNYKVLIEKGRDYIEKIANKIWTDYNVHDPGITTLELLSYAITDLGHRIEMPVQELLAQKDLKGGGLETHFHSAKNILPTCPISEYDYRKIFIDIDGVENAWIFKSTTSLWIDCKAQYGENEDNYGVLSYDKPGSGDVKSLEIKGYYDILLQLDKEISDEDQENAIIEEARKKYYANRNLCEDLKTITTVPEQKVAFCSAIELEADAEPAMIWAKIIFAIEQYLHPSVQFNSLQQMLEIKDELGRPLTIDEIFEGPVLEHGFIANEELAISELRAQVRASDLIRIIMEIEGVKKIDDLLIDFCGEENPDIGGKWLLCIAAGHLPVLCNEKTIINFNKSELPVTYDKSLAENHLAELRSQHQLESEAYSYDDLPMPIGNYQKIFKYAPIQNDYPDNYGINQNGLPPNATAERRALAKQFKGYLMVYDQMLAFYMKHLSEVRRLFAVDDSEQKSYFSQALSGVKDMEGLFNNYGDLQSDINEIVGTLDNYHERKNRFLDHLIARFAERFSEFVFIMRDMFEENVEDELINYKKQFIRDYPALSRSRFIAANHLFPNDGNCGLFNLSGFQNRIMRLLGMLPIHEIYQEKDDDGIDEYRWRIFDKTGKIILSASTRYYTKMAALEEMWQTVFLAWDQKNFEIKLAEDETYYFNIIMKDGGTVVDGEMMVEDDEVVGRRIQFFDEEVEAEDAVAHVIDEMEEKTMRVFEHHLLLPKPSEDLDYAHFLPVCLDKNCEGCEPIDPYSFRITVVMPGWTKRFKNIDFRRFAEKTIRKECPAHILPKICWVSKEQMKGLQDVHTDWLQSKKYGTDAADTNTATKALLEVLLNLHTIYPEGMLHDCEDPEEGEIPVILNRTNLGNL